MIIPIRWSLQRKTIMPILEVKGESTITGSEVIVLQYAIRIIDKASECMGHPYPNIPTFPSTSNCCVSFSLIFPSEKEINSFMEFFNESD